MKVWKGGFGGCLRLGYIEVHSHAAYHAHTSAITSAWAMLKGLPSGMAVILEIDVRSFVLFGITNRGSCTCPECSWTKMKRFLALHLHQ